VGRTRLLNACNYLFSRGGELGAFGGGDPGEMQTAFINADMLEQSFKHGEPAAGIEITLYIVAVTRMATRNPDTICAAAESRKYHLGAYASGAWDSDNLEVGGILQTVDTGQVGCAVCTPVTEYRYNLWFPIRHFKYLLIRLFYRTV